jgi:gas vesicle protein
MDAGKHQGAFVFGAILGAIGGALAALLMTPKSGPQLRHELKDQAGGVQQLISDRTATVRDRSEGMVGSYVDKVSRMTQREHEADRHVTQSSATTQETPVVAMPQPDPMMQQEPRQTSS